MGSIAAGGADVVASGTAAAVGRLLVERRADLVLEPGREAADLGAILPSWRAASGSRVGPSTMSASRRMTSTSGPPTLNTEARLPGRPRRGRRVLAQVGDLEPRWRDGDGLVAQGGGLVAEGAEVVDGGGGGSGGARGCGRRAATAAMPAAMTSTGRTQRGLKALQRRCRGGRALSGEAGATDRGDVGFELGEPGVARSPRA